MKKKILSLILVAIMLVSVLPLTVLADAIPDASNSGETPPTVSVSSLYSYDEYYYKNLVAYRALPDRDGYFFFDIELDKAPTNNENIFVYYRTVDDSAVAAWGDYESVGATEEAYVTLSKDNGYKARVIVKSSGMEEGFVTGKMQDGSTAKDKLITRRFIFELTRVEGSATLSANKELYCYLRANRYHYQQADAQIKSDLKSTYDYVWRLKTESYQYKGYFPTMVENKAKYEDTIKYFSLLYKVPYQSRPTTPQIKYKGSHSDNFNISFSDEMRNFVQTGWCDLGIAINGLILRDNWDSDGPATFNLYYTYKGEKKLALTLNLEGEFDDSTYFGWEHAFEYLIEGRNDDEYPENERFKEMDREDFVNDNFNSIVIYDNDGNVAYKIEADRDDDESVDESDLRDQMRQGIISGHVVKYTHDDFQDTYNYVGPWWSNSDTFYYYLKLPSNYILADSYSYEFISDSTDKDEIRWLERVNVLFALLKNGQPKIAEDERGNQMISTNLDTIREGDPLRMSIRFDRPVHIADPNGLCNVTVDIYNDITCVARNVKLNLKQLQDISKSGAYTNYAWDTLVFEGDLPDSVKNEKIYAIRNIRLNDGSDAATNPTKGIRCFLTNESLYSKKIYDISGFDTDLRVPVAIVSGNINSDWATSRGVDVYVNVQGKNNASFNDYVTVFYEWSNSKEIPTTYSQKIVFNSAEDGVKSKRIVGTGNGVTYLHLMAVSAYGKSSVSDIIGPFRFDNTAPVLSGESITATGTLKNITLSVPLPNDGGGCGLKTIDLYYTDKVGEEKRLASFTADDFKGDPKKLTYTISHDKVGVGVDLNGNFTLERRDVEIYWITTDELGNESGKTGQKILTFDTNDYLESEIGEIGPYNISDDPSDMQFVSATQKINGRNYIYNYKKNQNKNTVTHPSLGKEVYYGFYFTVDHSKFGDSDTGVYDAKVYFRGEEFTDYVVREEESGIYVVWILANAGSGRYDIQLTRTQGESVRVSQVCSVVATNDEKDETAIAKKIKEGTLLSNSVYQLTDSEFHYKDADGNRKKEYYGGVKQPASFSSYAKAKEYVYYKELGDIYLVQLTENIANALNSGTAEYQIAKGETMTPQAGQWWIRYKIDSWTPTTSGDSSWVYYYYGMNGKLSEGALSLNLQSALDAVATRIVTNGKTVVLTDTSLISGIAPENKMLDKYGMPYLLAGQIHNGDEFSTHNQCGQKWSVQVTYAGDRNIYKSTVYVGNLGGPVQEEYPLVGDFALPEDSIFQYKTYEDAGKQNSAWKDLDIKKGETFINVLTASGVYFIREISADGVAVYPIYIDKEAPGVIFSNTDSNGELKEIPIDGYEISDIRTKDLYIGKITDVDRLSYVAVYKTINNSLVGIYSAEDVEYSHVKLEDGNYYIVVSDRSGNHYAITAKVSSTELECRIKETEDRFITLTCNRDPKQILRYEVYLNGELITSTYSADQRFDKSGYYTVYIQDIYGNVFTDDHTFTRKYPTATWRYLGSDGRYYKYDSASDEITGFDMSQVSENEYKISTAVKTRFSISGEYEYVFVGAVPKFTETYGTERTVTIDEGQSFTLKVYYKNHTSCYTTYSGVVDIVPPSINVSADIDVLSNGEHRDFDKWLENGEAGDVIIPDELYYSLSEIKEMTVPKGGTISSDIIKINVSDANELSLVEVYLNGALIKRQDTGFSQIIVSQWGDYRIVAKDALGNVSEFTFTNGVPDGLKYFVDGAEKQLELHAYLNFEKIGDKTVYTKVDYGNRDFRLDLTKNADIFMSVGMSGETTEIYGFRISNGSVYPLTYSIVLDKNGDKEIELSVGEAILDISSNNFNPQNEYLISKTGSYAIYALVGADRAVSVKVNAPENTSKVVSVSARVEIEGSNTSFVSAEISKKSSEITFDIGKENTVVGSAENADIRINSGFLIDETLFERERIASIGLYYSALNDLDINNLDGKTNIYTSGKEYTEEGFYLLIVKNHYGSESVIRISISKSFGVTSSVTFGDGHKIYYSKDYGEKLYSNNLITLDILDGDVTVNVTLNGAAYTGFLPVKDALIFFEEGRYTVRLTDSYGNEIVRELEINKSTHTVSPDLLTGYNDKALKRDEGYTNQKLTVNKAVYDKDGSYYLAVQYGDTLTVLFDSFAETPVNTDGKDLIGIIGSMGDGLYKIICRNRYGAVVTMDIHYRGTPTLKLERTTRSDTESQVYDLNYALSLGFWSNNSLKFSTEAKTYVFTVNGNVTECPRTLVFENSGDFGNFEYDITYIDEYGFEYKFKAYLVRKNVTVDIPTNIKGLEIDGILNTKNDISVTFGENVYATYTRNNGEEMPYHSGDILKKDGTYRFTVVDYAGNASKLVIKKDTVAEFALTETESGVIIRNGYVVNSSKVGFRILNKDSAYIEKVIKDGVHLTDFSGTSFSEDGKWELIISDKLGNKAYFSFYIVTREKNGFAYTTPYEYQITEMWYDSGDGVKISYMNFVNHSEFTSSFNFLENGKYTAVMTSETTGATSTFSFTVNTKAPEVSLVGCNVGETTINDVTIAGCKVGDRIKIYQTSDKGDKLVQEIEVTSQSTVIPTITEGGKYRIVVESEAGVATELTFVRKHVMNTAGSIFIMIIIALAVIGLFTGLVYRNKSKTDD